MKLKDVTSERNDIVDLLKMTTPYKDSLVRVFTVVGTDTMIIHNTYSSGQHSSLSNRERPVKSSEIRNVISKIMKTKTDKVKVYKSRLDTIHIDQKY